MTTRHIDTGSDELLCSVDGHVATITLNNPAKRNALSPGLTSALARMLADTDSDPDIRALVITGAQGAFCAGGDIGGMGQALADGEVPDADSMIDRLRRAQNEVSLQLYEHSKPTIAALPGPAAGAGMSISLAADLRIAGTSGCLVPAFGAIGLSGDFGGSWLLSQLVGPGLAKEIYFTGRRVNADEALSLGLVNRVVPDESLTAETAALAAQIAGGAPVALRYMKDNFNRAGHCDFRTALDMEADHMIRSMLTDDHREAARAFFEKRKPVFRGH